MEGRKTISKTFENTYKIPDAEYDVLITQQKFTFQNFAAMMTRFFIFFSTRYSRYSKTVYCLSYDRVKSDAYILMAVRKYARLNSFVYSSKYLYLALFVMPYKNRNCFTKLNVRRLKRLTVPSSNIPTYMNSTHTIRY